MVPPLMLSPNEFNAMDTELIAHPAVQIVFWLLEPNGVEPHCESHC